MEEELIERLLKSEEDCAELTESDIMESDKLILTEEGWQMIARYHFENVQLNAAMGVLKTK